jgi:hypothetical protein
MIGTANGNYTANAATVIINQDGSYGFDGSFVDQNTGDTTTLVASYNPSSGKAQVAESIVPTHFATNCPFPVGKISSTVVAVLTPSKAVAPSPTASATPTPTTSAPASTSPAPTTSASPSSSPSATTGQCAIEFTGPPSGTSYTVSNPVKVGASEYTGELAGGVAQKVTITLNAGATWATATSSNVVVMPATLNGTAIVTSDFSATNC